MKAFLFAVLLMATMGFVLLGCSDNSTPLVSPNDAVVSSATTAPSLAKGCAGVGSATGGGEFKAPGGAVTMFSSVKFAFTAWKHKGGASGGEVEMNLVGMDRSLGGKFHAKVKDAKFHGNVAMFWAELKTQIFAPFFPDFPNATWKTIIVVTDNGEGKKAIRDRMSNPWFTSEEIFPGEFDQYWAMSAEEFLASIPTSIGTPSDYPLARGNIEVRNK